MKFFIITDFAINSVKILRNVWSIGIGYMYIFLQLNLRFIDLFDQKKMILVD